MGPAWGRQLNGRALQLGGAGRRHRHQAALPARVGGTRPLPAHVATSPARQLPGTHPSTAWHEAKLGAPRPWLLVALPLAPRRAWYPAPLPASLQLPHLVLSRRRGPGLSDTVRLDFETATKGEVCTSYVLSRAATCTMHWLRPRATVLLLCLAGVAAANWPRRRQAALDAMALAAEEGGTAAQVLKRAKAIFEKMTKERPPTHFKEYVLKWTARQASGAGLQGTQKGGRPPKLPPDLVETIARVWTQAGVGRGGDRRAYSSMKEVSCRTAPCQRAPPAVDGAAAAAAAAQGMRPCCAARTCRPCSGTPCLRSW